ncbi:hypothetical protein PUW24_05020 [Paenibacillus urinalis]|uniref:hypothetical protein n=1 Tax=Paenibacillus urinalis TaxID=521520 RepID=UPI002367BFC8|nr:hypothetical protein [Paenibacillus urinalis]WDH98301.1 hypothetical protein PUW24_05020 [Paenibacillus urinalis]
MDHKHTQKALLWITAAVLIIGQGTSVGAVSDDSSDLTGKKVASFPPSDQVVQALPIQPLMSTYSDTSTLTPSNLLYSGEEPRAELLGAGLMKANPDLNQIGASASKPKSNSTAKNSSTSKSSNVSSTKSDKPIHTLNNLKPVKLTSKSTVKLTDLNVLTQEDGKTLTYTLTYQNNDSKTLMLIDYWTKVKTKGGTLYSPNLIARDQEKKSVAAGSSLAVTYIVKVGKNVKVSDLLFQIVKWDFSKPNYESHLGHFNVPASYTLSTPVNQSKTIRLNDTPIKIKVSKFEFHSGSDYNYAEVSVNLHNTGYKLLENPTAKWILRTAGGSNYPLLLDSAEATYSIQPQENKTLKLLSSIPKSVKLAGAELIVVEEEGEAKTVLPLATLQLPAASTTQTVATQPFKPRQVTVENLKLETTLEAATVSQSYGSNDLSLSFKFKNISKETITVPKYEFLLKSGNGNSYPMTTKALENLSLQPGAEKTIKLDISVSYEVAQGALKLIMNTPKSEDPESKAPAYSYPAGIYILPQPSSMQNTLGREISVKNDSGTYGVTWSSIQRLPWTDGDLLSAKLTVKNTSVKTLRLPDLQGVYTIDAAKDASSTKLIKSQAASLLGPGQAVDMYLVTKIPTSLDIAQLQVALEEKVGEESTEWIKLTNIGAIPEVPEIEKDEAYTLTTLGKKAEIKTRKSVVFPGTTTDLVYTELEMTNMENRQADLSQLSGYYMSSSGLYFKANVKQIDYPAGPEDKSIVTMWTKIPKRVTVSDMRLIVGEGVTEDKLTPVKGEATGYVNAASLEISPQQITALTTIQNFELFPYQVQTHTFDAYLSGGSNVSIEWYYTLSQNNEYSLPENEHKFIVEITDSTGRAFAKELVPGTDMKLGANQLLSWSIDDRIFEDRRAGTYQISIYDEFQGQRLKIAGQSMYYNPNRLPAVIPEE